jgi:hypothetical protein
MYNARATISSIASSAAVHLLTTDGKTEKTLFTAESIAIYAAPGYALYLRGSLLVARPFDAAAKRNKMASDCRVRRAAIGFMAI